LLRALLAAAALGLGVSPCVAQATSGNQDTVLVRVGEHKDFTRVVFDWAVKAEFQIERQGAVAVIQFDRPAAIKFDTGLTKRSRRLRNLESSDTPSGVRVTITAVEGAEFRESHSGPKVVIDIYASGAKPPAPAATPETTTAPAPAATAAPAAAATGLTPPPLKPATAAPVAPTATPAPVASEGTNSGAERAMPDAAAITPSGAMVVHTAPTTGRTVLRVTADGDGAVLRIDFSQPVAAAAFGRAGAVWLIFDQVTVFDLRNLAVADQAVLGDVVQIQHPTASVLRVTGNDLAVARLHQENSAWFVDFRNGVERPDVEIKQTAERDFAGRAKVILDPSGPSRPIAFNDPEMGDRLWVVPVRGTGEGIGVRHQWPEIRLLPARQGIVIEPLDDRVQVVTVDDKVEISLPEGLSVSNDGSKQPDAEAVAAEEASRPTLLAMEAWRRSDQGGFTEVRQMLQHVETQATPERKNVARLDLARFYFAHGLAAEAAGYIELIERSTGPTLDPELLLIKGASRLLLDDERGAGQSLNSPSLDGEAEGELWRAALAAANGEWEAATQGFEYKQRIIAAYPRPLRMRLTLLAALAEIEGGDPIAAVTALDALRADGLSREEADQVNHLEGRRALREGHLPAAKEIWFKLTHSSHLPTQAWAGYDLVDVGLTLKEITPAEAIERLDKLRYVWRDERFEFTLLQRLGTLYLDAGRIRDGLTLLRQAISNYPERREVGAIARQMSEVFRVAFLGPNGSKMTAVAAVALYDEFQELTPPDADGDRIVIQLIDNLVAMDLLQRAGDLLDDQVRHRLTGADRARTGARLADVRLLDRKPDAALEALSISAAPDLSEEVQLLRREIEVRALFEAGRAPEALALLENAADPAALLMRADMLWRLKEWSASAAALGDVLDKISGSEGGSPLPGVSVDTLVLNRAVALSLAGDQAGLRGLALEYGEAMARGPEAEPFAVLTADLGDVEGTRGMAERLASADRLTRFMDEYRKRLQTAANEAAAAAAAAQ
jgi:tetratricopeptide (TPR) repeat protein